jgi:hypothetical protein
VSDSARDDAYAVVVRPSVLRTSWGEWSRGWVDQLGAGTAGNGGVHGQWVCTGRTFGPMSRRFARATIQAAHLDTEPGATSKTASLGR